MTKPKVSTSEFDQAKPAERERCARVHFRGADSGVPSVVGPFTVRTLVSGAETGGALSVVEYNAACDAPAEERHALSNEDTAILMSRGAATFEADGEEFALSAGASLYVARGVRMRRVSVDAEDTSYLIVFVPGGLDRFFVDTARLIEKRLADGITMEDIMPEVRKIQSKYGIV
jgi:quercetin dioxygenase-like cupin family protein